MTVRQRTLAIKQDIINRVENHPADIAAVICKLWDISRQAVNKHLKDLCDEGVLTASGKTTARIYKLQVLFSLDENLPIKGLAEHVPWIERIHPKLIDVPKNVGDICHYGFTEILNNAIDHSGSEFVNVRCVQTAASICITIHDFGIGIFKKIKKALNLADERESILELVKGKLTTDPEHHSGEGIFFTSRMVDLFSMWSGPLYFTHVRPDSDWLIEDNRTEMPGTDVNLVVSMKSKVTPKSIFDEYTTAEDFTFSKTHVPIRLAQYGSDNLISRSQAKRILSRFQRFSEVFLDFSGIEFIGQAFADEIFRVFQTSNPRVKLVVTNACPAVRTMIERAIIARRERQLELKYDE